MKLRLLEEHPPIGDLKRVRLRRLIAKILQEEDRGICPVRLAADVVPRLCSWFEDLRLDHRNLPILESEARHLRAWGLHAGDLPDPDQARLKWLEAYPAYLRGHYEESLRILRQAQGRLASAISSGSVVDTTRLLHASILNDIGAMTCETGGKSPEAAAAPLSEALAIRKDVLGRDHEDTAMTMANLGSATSDKDLMLEALDIRVSVCGPKSEWTAWSLTELARHERLYGKVEDGKDFAKRALEASQNDAEPAKGKALTQMADCLNDEADPSAIEVATDAVAALRHCVGDDHVLTMEASRTLGAALYRNGRTQEALDLAIAAAKRTRKTLGATHRDLVKDEFNIAATLDDMGQTADSLAHAIPAWKLFGQVGGLGPNMHYKLAILLSSLHMKIKDGKRSLQFAEEAASVARDHLSEDEGFLIRATWEAARALGLDKRPAEAVALLSKTEADVSDGGKGRLQELKEQIYRVHPGLRVGLQVAKPTDMTPSPRKPATPSSKKKLDAQKRKRKRKQGRRDRKRGR